MGRLSSIHTNGGVTSNKKKQFDTFRQQNRHNLYAQASNIVIAMFESYDYSNDDPSGIKHVLG